MAAQFAIVKPRLPDETRRLPPAHLPSTDPALIPYRAGCFF